MAAAKRAEIERRLAQLQIAKEREEALLRQLEEQGDVEDLDAHRIAAAAQREETSISVYGATVSVGDRVAVTSDSSALRAHEASLPRKQILKRAYLGETGTVVAVFSRFHGHPAAELEFADGRRYIYLAACLAVGSRDERSAATKAVKGPPPAAAAKSGVTASGPADSQSTAIVPVKDTEAASAACSEPPREAASMPIQLPRSLPRRGQRIAKVAPANAGAAFLAELNIMADMGSELSSGSPTEPPAATSSEVQKAQHADPAAPARRPITASTSAKRPVVASRTAAATSAAKATTPATSNGAPKAVSRTAPATSSVPTPRPATASKATAGTLSDRAPASRVAAAGAARPVTVKVYENGAYGDLVNDRVPFKSVTIRPVHKSMASVLTLVGQTLEWSTQGRKVETLYNAATGKPIRDPSELSPTVPVIASMGDAFIKPRTNSQLFSELPFDAQETLANDSPSATITGPRASAPAGKTAQPKTPTSQRPGLAPTRTRPAAKTVAPATTTQQPRVATARKQPSDVAVSRAPARATPGKRPTAASLMSEIHALETQLESV